MTATPIRRETLRQACANNQGQKGWLDKILKMIVNSFDLPKDGMMTQIANELEDVTLGQKGRIIPDEVYEAITGVWQTHTDIRDLQSAIQHILMEQKMMYKLGIILPQRSIYQRLLNTVHPDVNAIMKKWALNKQYNKLNPAIIEHDDQGFPMINVDSSIPENVEKMLSRWKEQIALMCAQAQVNITNGGRIRKKRPRRPRTETN